jgi:hypothetical protein
MSNTIFANKDIGDDTEACFVYRTATLPYTNGRCTGSQIARGTQKIDVRKSSVDGRIHRHRVG